MKNREAHIEFDRNYCTHYAPKPGAMMKDYCALGLGASEAMDRARIAGEPNMSPCIGGHKATDPCALCPKWDRRSLEHAEKRADSIEEMFRRMDVVGPVVAKWRTWTKRNRVAKQEAIEARAPSLCAAAHGSATPLKSEPRTDGRTSGGGEGAGGVA